MAVVHCTQKIYCHAAKTIQEYKPLLEKPVPIYMNTVNKCTKYPCRVRIYNGDFWAFSSPPLRSSSPP